MSDLKLGQKLKLQKYQLEVKKELGSGAFGTVYKVHDITSKKTYALKQVICYDQSDSHLVKREVEMMVKANHERIVRILGFVSYKASFLILLEFCSGGDLNSRLDKPSTKETNLKWILQIAEALNYLHSRNPPIVHRDLKADNVLLTDKSSEDLKLGDFGLAREYFTSKSSDASSSYVQTYYMTSNVGPRHWMAPEFFHKRYTEKADIFSLGGIFYAILTRDFVQYGKKKMYGVFVTTQSDEKIGLGYAMAEDQEVTVQFPPHFQGSNPMKQLIKEMLSYEKNERPTANEVQDRVRQTRSSTSLTGARYLSYRRNECC